MKIKDKINADYLTAFKEKNTVAKNLLSVVKGEIQTVEKNTGSSNLEDDVVIKILNKTAKSLKETIQMSDDVESKTQLAIIEIYLPKSMNRDEIVSKVTELVNSGTKDIGGIMKAFANLPADKKLVSEVIREVIK